ncbi:MAG: hypothetical protein H7Y15_02530 [Pseudonocardia sp.]|nr:hypothetical protein [Pseudonocardia sp.]
MAGGDPILSESELLTLDEALDVRRASASLAWQLVTGDQGSIRSERAHLVLERDLPGLLSRERTRAHAVALAAELWEYLFVHSGGQALTTQAASWVGRSGLSRAEALRLANRMAWVSRGAIDHLTPRDPDSAPGSPADLFVIALTLERLRFLFQFAQLATVVDGMAEDRRSEPFVQAMRAFALLGGRHPLHRDSGLAIVQRVWDSASDRRERLAIQDVCLHALWVAEHLPEQGRVLLDYCRRAEQEALESGDERAGPVVLFRKAYALRELADYDSALIAIDTALGDLRGDNEFVRTFSEQCIRERQLIIVGRDLTRLTTDLEETSGQISAAEHRIEAVVERNSIRSVEVLGLFSAAVAFAVGTSSIGANAASPLAGLLIAVALGACLLGFSWMILFVAGPRVREPAGSRGSGSRVGSALGWSALACSVVAILMAAIAVMVVYFS